MHDELLFCWTVWGRCTSVLQLSELDNERVDLSHPKTAHERISEEQINPQFLTHHYPTKIRQFSAKPKPQRPKWSNNSDKARAGAYSSAFLGRECCCLQAGGRTVASMKYLHIDFPFQGCSLSAQGPYVDPLQGPFGVSLQQSPKKLPPLQVFLRPWSFHAATPAVFGREAGSWDQHSYFYYQRDKKHKKKRKNIVKRKENCYLMKWEQVKNRSVWVHCHCRKQQ